MKKIYSIAIFVLFTNLLFINAAFGQAVGDYRSNTDADWNVLTTWQRYNGATWVTPTAGQGYPGQNSGTGAVTILGNDDIVITATVPNAIASLTIGDGSGTNETVAFSLTSAITLTVTGAVTLDDGNLTVTNQSNPKTHTLNIGGNFTVGSTSTFDGASSNDYLNVVLNGTGTQTIGGTLASIPFQDLTINKSSGGVTLGTDITITGGTDFGTVTLTSGVLTATSTNTITFNDGAVVSGASNSSYVDGPVTKVGNDVFTFPTGDPLGSYHTIVLDNSVGGGATGDSYTAEYFRASALTKGPIASGSGLYGVSHCEYWQLTRSSGSGTPSVSVSWTANSPCGGPYVTTLTGLTVAWLNGSTQWQVAPGTSTTNSGTTAAGTSQRVGISNFGFFTLGNLLANGSPLPVKFGNIKAYEKQQGIQIDWTVYSEENVAKYQVERSTDGSNFTVIGEVNALNAVSETRYSFFDPNPFSAVNFYRIRNIDIDARSSFSNIVKVNLDKSVKGITIYPNPVRNGIVSFQGSDLAKGDYTLRIFNTSGQQVYTQKFNHSGGAINQTIQLPVNVKSGMYTMQLDGENAKVMSKSFLIQ